MCFGSIKFYFRLSKEKFLLVKAKSIAIDGPVASGKTSVGLELARRLGYLFLDTGVMYRAATLAVLQAGMDVHDENAISALVTTLNIEVINPSLEDGRTNDVILNGEDVTWDIRKKMVNDYVSTISTYKIVREVLTKSQRKFGKGGKVVMVGRDIGTVVLPDADLKIFLKASVEERARRRYDEERERGAVTSYHEILENMKKRDALDSSRELAPLSIAQDAVLIDTNGKNLEEVVQEIIHLVSKEE